MRKEKGFVLGGILAAIVLLALVAGVIAASVSSSSLSVKKEQDQIMASTIISQAASIAENIDLARDGFNITDTIVLTDDDPCAGGSYCLYNAQDGMMATPIMPVDAVTDIDEGTDTGVWVLRDNLALSFPDLPGAPEAGTAASDEVLVLKGVSQAVCQQINTLSHELPLYQTIPSYDGGGDLTQIGVVALDIDGSDFDETAISGCVDDGSGIYYYFHLITAN